MKIKLVLKDWQKEGKSISQTMESAELPKYDFYSGSTFDGSIDLDALEEKELRKALERGYRPVFWVY